MLGWFNMFKGYKGCSCRLSTFFGLVPGLGAQAWFAETSGFTDG